MKIGFLSSVEVGYKTLKQLYLKGVPVELVLSLHPDLASRTSGYMDFSQIACDNKSQHFFIKNINSSRTETIIRNSEIDLLVVCGFQRLLKDKILQIPSKGCVGFHASLLPAFRGRAPVNWAIIEGANQTGVSFFYLDVEADAGDLIDQIAFPIEYEDDVHSIYEKVNNAYLQLLNKHLKALEDGTLPRLQNPGKNAPMYPARTPEDDKTNWNWSS